MKHSMQHWWMTVLAMVIAGVNTGGCGDEDLSRSTLAPSWFQSDHEPQPPQTDEDTSQQGAEATLEDGVILYIPAPGEVQMQPQNSDGSWIGLREYVDSEGVWRADVLTNNPALANLALAYKQALDADGSAVDSIAPPEPESAFDYGQIAQAKSGDHIGAARQALTTFRGACPEYADGHAIDESQGRCECLYNHSTDCGARSECNPMKHGVGPIVPDNFSSTICNAIAPASDYVTTLPGGAQMIDGTNYSWINHAFWQDTHVEGLANTAFRFVWNPGPAGGSCPGWTYSASFTDQWGIGNPCNCYITGGQQICTGDCGSVFQTWVNTCNIALGTCDFNRDSVGWTGFRPKDSNRTIQYAQLSGTQPPTQANATTDIIIYGRSNLWSNSGFCHSITGAPGGCDQSVDETCVPQVSQPIACTTFFLTPDRYSYSTPLLETFTPYGVKKWHHPFIGDLWYGTAQGALITINEQAVINYASARSIKLGHMFAHIQCHESGHALGLMHNRDSAGAWQNTCMMSPAEGGHPASLSETRGGYDVLERAELGEPPSAPGDPCTTNKLDRLRPPFGTVEW